MDVFHIFGEDLKFSEKNDILKVFHPEEATQRILRRLLTPKGSYIWHPEYGCSVPQYIGESLTDESIENLKADITDQVLKEDFVANTPAPSVDIIPYYNYIDCVIKYQDNVLGKYQQLNFTVTK